MSKKIRSCAIYKDLIIESAEDYTVTIRCRDRKTRNMLREISEDLGFEYSDEWNTRYFGHRLINFINGVDTRRETTKLAEDKFPEELISDTDTTEYISDEDWEWWCSLSYVMKCVLLWNLRDKILEADNNLIPELDTENGDISISVDLNDRNTAISYYVGKYFTGQYGSDRTYKAGTVTSLVIPKVYDVEDDFDKLSHIKQLSSLSLRDKDIIVQGYVTSMIASIPQLEELDLSGNDLFLYSLESLKDIKNLKKLYLEKVKIALTEDYLSSDELNVVKELLPNCEIIA